MQEEKRKRLRVLLADDDQEILKRVRKLLELEFDVIDTVRDGGALLRAVEELEPDIAIVDISMPVLNGIAATRRIMKAVPSTRVIILTVHESPAYMSAAFTAGAVGYVAKLSMSSDLRHAIRKVMDGVTFRSSCRA